MKVTALQVSSEHITTYFDFPSQFVAKRDVHIWLPEGYHQNAKQKYSVLYMHDGQMLFDARYTWHKQKWRADEAATKVISDGKVPPFIIVGINNGGKDLRYPEYFPQKVLEFVADSDAMKRGILERNLKADSYLQFLTTELIPYIERSYPVKKGRKNRAVAGSSMGGLISLYAFLEYPKVFGTVLAISTHWPGGHIDANYQLLFQGMLDYMQQKLQQKAHRGGVLYFDTGTHTLDQHYPPLQERVDILMRKFEKQFSSYHSYIYDGASHDEISWAARLPQILEKLVLFR